jgi:hypothetical protein
MNTDISKLVQELSKIEIDYQGESSWLEHGSFMHWIVEKLNPRIFVELGSHYGYSYFAACQSIKAHSLDTKAFAIDTWQGDEHAGFYGNEVYKVVDQINSQKYSSFSKLLQMTFNEGLNNFELASIDLLHIDGLHTYDAVAHDFNSWKEKLSNRAIVLFHDIHEHRDDFEVNRFWLELQAEYPTFEFFHEHGLGVLKFGTEFTELDFLFDKNLTESFKQFLRYIFRSSGVYSSIEAQLKAKDKIIEMYYSDLMKQIELNKKHEDAISVLNSVIDDIKSSISWKLTSPVRTLSNIKRS